MYVTEFLLWITEITLISVTNLQTSYDTRGFDVSRPRGSPGEIFWSSSK